MYEKFAILDAAFLKHTHKHTSMHAVETLEDLKVLLEASKKTFVIQVGSETCSRCPDFTNELNTLSSTYHFEWGYADAPSASELTEEFGVAKLPAMVLAIAGEEKQVFQNCTPEDARRIVSQNCKPKLDLEADF